MARHQTSSCTSGGCAHLPIHIHPHNNQKRITKADAERNEVQAESGKPATSQQCNKTRILVQIS
jgi:hypothetical protein